MLTNPTSPDVDIRSPLTTFGEVKTADATPRVQIDGVYGVLATDIETFTDGASGSTTGINSLLSCSTGTTVHVHTIRYPGSANIPHTKDPSLRVGWAVASLGSTTNLTVSGASAAGFVQGPILPLRDPFGVGAQFTATTTETAWLLLRNRVEFANRPNHRELLPATLSLSNETSNRIVRARMVINPVLSGVPDWAYVDQANSSTEWAIGTGITVTGGRQIAAIAATTQQRLDVQPLDPRLEPNDVLAVCVRTASSTAVADTSLNWLEE